MALSWRYSHEGQSLPDFREGSELVEGLQNIGTDHQDGRHVSVININNFENNWEDLDEEFSKQEIFTPELKDFSSGRSDVRYRLSDVIDKSKDVDQKESSASWTRSSGLFKSDVHSQNEETTNNAWTSSYIQDQDHKPSDQDERIAVSNDNSSSTFWEPVLISDTKTSQKSMEPHTRDQSEISGVQTEVEFFNLQTRSYSDDRNRNFDPQRESYNSTAKSSSRDNFQAASVDIESTGLRSRSNIMGPVKSSDVNLYQSSKGTTRPGQKVERFSLIVGSDRQEGDSSIGCCGGILWVLSILLIICTFPFSICLCIKVVQEYERAVIFRLGRLLSGGAKGPGLFFIVPCIDSYTKVDIRTVSFDVPPQEVLTKDSVTVAVDAVVYYRIQNATMSITNVEDSNRSTRLLAATTLRNVLGTKNLSEILSDRESISHVMQTSLDEATDPWGVKVERVEVKDVRLPVQLQRAMAAEAEAAREARAKVIAAEGEQKASRALKEAADVMSESPAAIQLRYLQTLNTISAEKNSTIIFPLPIDLMQGFMRGSGGGSGETSHF